jgi:signal transduction histidine kinase
VLNRRQPRSSGQLESGRAFAAPTIKVALLCGFTLIGGIWVWAGYYFTARMAELEERSAAINARYMRAPDVLTETGGHVLMGSVYVRDALLDPNPSSAAAYRIQLEESYRAADEALGRYEPVIDVPGERNRIARLRREVDSFRRTLLEVLETDSRSWPTTAPALLRGRIMPKREGVMRISRQVQSLNRSALVQQQKDISALYRLTQRHVWQSFGLALAASFSIALLSMLYAGRLEARIQRQRLKDVENARDLQRLSSQLLTAQEQERRAIARELHDEVGQVLTAIKVELSLAQHAVEAAGAPPNLLEDARSITDGALHTVRDLSHLLHPALLDDLGLPSAVAAYLKGFGRRHEVDVDLLHNGMDERLLPEIESAAYRIIQEALTNVARHAQAKTCRIRLQRLADILLVTIEDDGIGFDVAAVEQARLEHGLGLIGIRERVAQLGGKLRVDTGQGKGVRLIVELPARLRVPAAHDAGGDESGAAMTVPAAHEVLRCIS